MSFHGNPCWYELGTGDLQGASDFYARIFGWEIADSGMEGYQYSLAKSDGDMVAGLMRNSDQVGNPAANWLIYFAVDDCDRSAGEVKSASGTIQKGPDDIPGTGRYAVVADPQGAFFGLLQPDMSQMSEADRVKAEAGEGAFNQKKAGHGNWSELMSTDPAAALDFYTGLFGWTKGEAMDMGAMGAYQLIRRNGVDIGAIMGLGNSPRPAWLPYFGVAGTVTKTVDAIRSAGGKLHHGPVEVPGPAYIAVAQDPQGAWFAVVGAEE